MQPHTALAGVQETSRRADKQTSRLGSGPRHQASAAPCWPSWALHINRLGDAAATEEKGGRSARASATWKNQSSQRGRQGNRKSKQRLEPDCKSPDSIPVPPTRRPARRPRHHGVDLPEMRIARPTVSRPRASDFCVLCALTHAQYFLRRTICRIYLRSAQGRPLALQPSGNPS